MINVVYTCKGRPSLTELCLRRFTELMPPSYRIYICYDGKDENYINMLKEVILDKDGYIIHNKWGAPSRFALINTALKLSNADYYIHLENDFYWVDPICLDAALNAFKKWPEIDYIRFEYLPFTEKQFYRREETDFKDILWMKDDTPFRFTFNPHIRRQKFPCGEVFQTTDFTKQPEQHHNDAYYGVSCCMTGDNFRHLGVYSEGGHYKEYYADRFTGRRNTENFDPWTEFTKLTDNGIYLDLFMRYLRDNGYKHSS